MNSEHMLAWSLAAAAWTAVLHFRWRSDDDDIKFRPLLQSVSPALELLTANFGTSFWTLRGLGMSIGTCWSVYGLAYLLNVRGRFLGDGSYAVIVAATVFVFTFFVPLVLHAVVHTMRKCLQWSQAHFSPVERAFFASAILLVPLAVLVIALVPVSIFLAVVDGGGFRLQTWLVETGRLIGILTLGWLEADVPVTFKIPAVLLNGPLMVLATFIASHVLVTIGHCVVNHLIPTVDSCILDARQTLALVHMITSAGLAGVLYVHAFV